MENKKHSCPETEAKAQTKSLRKTLRAVKKAI